MQSGRRRYVKNLFLVLLIFLYFIYSSPLQIWSIFTRGLVGFSLFQLVGIIPSFIAFVYLIVGLIMMKKYNTDGDKIFRFSYIINAVVFALVLILFSLLVFGRVVSPEIAFLYAAILLLAVPTSIILLLVSLILLIVGYMKRKNEFSK